METHAWICPRDLCFASRAIHKIAADEHLAAARRRSVQQTLDEGPCGELSCRAPPVHSLTGLPLEHAAVLWMGGFFHSGREPRLSPDGHLISRGKSAEGRS